MFGVREDPSTIVSTAGTERNEVFSITCSKASPPLRNDAAKRVRISWNICGAAPWKEKIDCFSSPTAKKVRALPAARPGEKLARELFENPPLRRARVLRLVDENMVDAGIELVEHPARVRAFEQRQRARDQSSKSSCPRAPLASRSGRRLRPPRIVKASERSKHSAALRNSRRPSRSSCSR